MLNIGPLELLLIFLIALIVVGPKKLPDLGRTIGKGMREFRKAQDEVRQSLQLDELKDMKREITDVQRGVRDALRFEAPKATDATSAPRRVADASADPGADEPAVPASPDPPTTPDPTVETE